MLELKLEGGAAAPPRDDDILAQIAKADFRYCSGVSRRRDKRLTLRSWSNREFVFAAGHLLFKLDLDTTKSILDGTCLPIGDNWIEQRSIR